MNLYHYLAERGFNVGEATKTASYRSFNLKFEEVDLHKNVNDTVHGDFTPTKVRAELGGALDWDLRDSLDWIFLRKIAEQYSLEPEYRGMTRGGRDALSTTIVTRAHADNFATALDEYVTIRASDTYKSLREEMYQNTEKTLSNLLMPSESVRS